MPRRKFLGGAVTVPAKRVSTVPTPSHFYDNASPNSPAIPDTIAIVESAAIERGLAAGLLSYFGNKAVEDTAYYDAVSSNAFLDLCYQVIRMQTAYLNPAVAGQSPDGNLYFYSVRNADGLNIDHFLLLPSWLVPTAPVIQPPNGVTGYPAPNPALPPLPPAPSSTPNGGGSNHICFPPAKIYQGGNGIPLGLQEHARDIRGAVLSVAQSYWQHISTVPFDPTALISATFYGLGSDTAGIEFTGGGVTGNETVNISLNGSASSIPYDITVNGEVLGTGVTIRLWRPARVVTVGTPASHIGASGSTVTLDLNLIASPDFSVWVSCFDTSQTVASYFFSYQTWNSDGGSPPKILADTPASGYLTFTSLGGPDTAVGNPAPSFGSFSLTNGVIWAARNDTVATPANTSGCNFSLDCKCDDGTKAVTFHFDIFDSSTSSVVTTGPTHTVTGNTWQTFTDNLQFFAPLASSSLTLEYRIVYESNNGTGWHFDNFTGVLN